MNKLATIEKIHSIAVHPKADKLQIAKILGWPVVIKKDEFKEGDLVIFIRIDCIVPSDNPYFKFLEPRKYKVWNAKFRGMPSSGLVIPLNAFPNVSDIFVGKDITQELGIIKYEKPLPVSMDAIGNFPTHLISITDEENILNYPEIIAEFNDNLPLYISLKCDGSSGTILNDNGTIRICSRRLELKEGSLFHRVFEKYDLINKIKNYPNIAIQAEMVGLQFQGNKMGLTENELRVFRVKNLEENRYLSLNEMKELCAKLDIPTVKVLEIVNVPTTIEYLEWMANEATYLRVDGKIVTAEGIVIRPINPVYSSILGTSLSGKIINQNYE